MCSLSRQNRLWMIVLIGLLSLSACRSRQQQALAQELKVDTQQYPLDYGFPAIYYRSVLTQTMTIAEVHGLIRGYTKVFQCKGPFEVYYYYSDHDRKALRFEVWYEEGRFSHMIGEDSDSRTIIIKDCEAGRLPE